MDSLPEGMPTLLFINSRFRIGAAIWEGPVVASADAIYLVQVRPVSAIGEVGRSFGLIGGLVAAAAQSVTGSRRSVSTCRLSELPPTVRNDPNWPRARADDSPVLVVPKDAVDSIRHPRFSNELRFTAGGEKILIGYRLFQGAKVRRFLSEAGWKLEW